MEGARFGVLIGAFVFGAFVLHNYANLNIGLKLTLEQGAAYFVEWTLVGVAFGLIYRAPTAHIYTAVALTQQGYIFEAG